MRALLPAGLMTLITWAAVGQPGESLPKFEAADVHASRRVSGPLLDGPFTGGGLYKLRFATMVDLIRIAYKVEADKVLGGPTWLELDRFDVIAKAPAGTAPETRRLMLRALLADRFHLVAHQGTKPARASALTVGQHLQLKQSDGSGRIGCGYFRPESGGATPTTMLFKCQNMTMPEFAEQVRNMGRQGRFWSPMPVVDRTELQGGWDFEFQYDPQLASIDDNTYLSQSSTNKSV